MRHTLALLCPPLALWACHRKRQATVAAILLGASLLTELWGVVAFVEFFLILWATNAAGDELGRRESQEFIKAVKPIPVIRH